MEVFQHQQLSVQVATNFVAGVPTRQLQFSRPDDPSKTIPDSSFSIPWSLTLSRRASGTTNWSPLLNNSTNLSYTDTSVVPGTVYEYLARFGNSAAGGFGQGILRQLVAGIEMPPQHQRGNVLLLVDNTLVPNLGAELNQLQRALVGDGWSVKQLLAPRHDNLNWSINTKNRPLVEGLITNNIASGVPNVIFILGHVTIPYSGTYAADGHDQNLGDHRGAWACDAYYGFLNKTPWTDTLNVNIVQSIAVPGDGKFDQNTLPGAPDFGVGRVDFDQMTIFTGLSEVDLLKRYLAKDFRYRSGTIPVYGRVSCHLAVEDRLGANSAQSFAGAAFGSNSGTVFSGYNFVQKVPVDLGVHFCYGGDAHVSDGTGDGSNLFNSAAFADPARELPVVFRNLWFSYGCDWARLNSQNQLSIRDNFLRASLGWPNYGLATMGGTVWDFSSLGAGGPLAEAMTRGWQNQVIQVPRFESILGDPTLRLFRLSSPTNVRAKRNDSSVTLTWEGSPDPNLGYYVYKSESGLGGFGLPLNPIMIQGHTYTDATPSNAKLSYQVRATKLQTTGSGSFWNLGQGAFVAVP